MAATPTQAALFQHHRTDNGTRGSAERFMYFLQRKWQHINANVGFALARVICQVLGTERVSSHLIVDLARSELSQVKGRLESESNSHWAVPSLPSVLFLGILKVCGRWTHGGLHPCLDLDKRLSQH